MQRKGSTHLWMKKKICLSAFQSSTTDCLFWIGQMAIQNFLRQGERSVVQEIADQREFFLKSTVGRSERGTIFLLERGMSRQVSSHNKTLVGPTA